MGNYNQGTNKRKTKQQKQQWLMLSEIRVVSLA